MNTEETNTKNVRHAGFWVRVLAAFLDGIVISALLSFVMLAFGKRYGIFNLNFSSSASITTSDIESLVTTAFQWAYNIFMLKYYGGATLGKMALKIKVVGDGKELDWVSIILRETVGKFISGIILGIGFLMVAWSPKKQGLHDRLAGTLVVYED